LQTWKHFGFSSVRNTAFELDIVAEQLQVDARILDLTGNRL
jgi:hypothetical protein